MDLLRHLRYFVTVADELHFGRAADRLAMAQPALSQRIQRLERELGVRLFDRSARRVALTEAGRLLLPRAQELLLASAALHELAAQVREGRAGSLRAGLLPGLPGAAVAALLAGFRRERAEIALRLREATTAEQLDALADGGLDVAVVRLPVDTSGLRLGPVLRRPLHVLLPADDPRAAAPVLRLADLAPSGLVLFPRAGAPALYDEILTTCARHGYAPDRVHQASSPDFALGLVLGDGVVALDDGTAADHPHVARRPLLGEPLSHRTATAWPRDREHPAVPVFAAVITEALRAHAGMSPVDAEARGALHPRPAADFLPAPSLEETP